MSKLGGLIGAVVGIGSGIALIVLLPGIGGWIILGVLLVATVVGYVVANKYVSSAASPCECPEGDFTRYLLVGLNAGLNGVLAGKIYALIFGTAAGVVLATALAALSMLAIFGSISTNDIYQAFLGWANWLLPTSWLIVLLGFLFWIVSGLGHLFGYVIGRSNYFRIQMMRADWKTGTFFTRGGLIANLNPIDTAFNMGTFAFVDAKPHLPPEESPEWHLEHEAGHTLNLGAFGSIFHLIGAIDENVTGGGHEAFSERLAESNDPATTLADIIIPMWAPGPSSTRQPI
ncbi:MAG: hypothetical protein GEU71_05250 [Actinobacteria bacterium]|nr:hypothetical protein [Actinomycetota bacterium]